MLDQGNLFRSLPSDHSQEVTEVLSLTPGLRVERIVSFGHSSPDGFWYDQQEDEWVVLLSGSATLRFADSDDTYPMVPGDWSFIPAHRRHRVESTHPTEASVWLAVFNSGTRPANTSEND